MENKIYLIDALGNKGYIRGPFGSSLKRGDMKKSGIPVYEQQNAINNNRIFRYFINEEKYQEMKRFTVQPGDLVISCSGTVGKVTLIQENDPIGIISQALLILRPNSSVILPKFLQYFFLTEKGHNSILERSGGSVQVNIARRSVIEKIGIPYFDISVQRKIVSILSSIDDKIELNSRMIANLEERIMTLYKHVFIENDQERVIKKAGDFFDVTIGKTPPRKEPQWFSSDSEDVKWVSISDMGKCGVYINDTTERLTYDAIRKFNVVVVPEDTVILSFKLTVGRVSITNGAMCTNEAIAHFGTDNNSINPYLYCYLKSFRFERLGSTSSIATAVNSKIIKEMPFVVPSTIELDEFNSIAIPSFEQIREIERENRQLSELRDTLLPKLMFGEIDIESIEL